MKHILEVTKKHIENGTPGYPNSCPIAICIKENIPNAGSASVGVRDTIITMLDKTQHVIKTCKAVSDWISDYDYEEHEDEYYQTEPIKIEIDMDKKVMDVIIEDYVPPPGVKMS